ncbi:hypothetical protein CDAR_278821 [Caerostris darwini]|uniref:Uncharacterized protein n=1 Tax=Caerostris darwini TaxID=1538125 RepID=A0AAV4WPC4_9ARAC|nr:hypothetical protein CDAR_278821 [Caerostris darwini]
MSDHRLHLRTIRSASALPTWDTKKKDSFFLQQRNASLLCRKREFLFCPSTPFGVRVVARERKKHLLCFLWVPEKKKKSGLGRRERPQRMWVSPHKRSIFNYSGKDGFSPMNSFFEDLFSFFFL